MFLDLLQTATSKAVAGAIGVAMIGGASYALAPTSDSNRVPDRFSLEIAPGGERFLCDLTVNAQQGCEKHLPRRGALDETIAVGRHAGDPTRVLIIVDTNRKSGITWPELQQGVVVGHRTLKALPAG